MRNILLNIFLSITTIFIYSCNPVNKHKILLYSQLPIDIQQSYQVLFNRKIKNWDCESATVNCNCNIEYNSGFLLTNPYLKIKDCKNEVKVLFSVTSARLFLITQKGVYFPIVTAFGYRDENNYKDIIKIKDINYGYIEFCK